MNQFASETAIDAIFTSLSQENYKMTQVKEGTIRERKVYKWPNTSLLITKINQEINDKYRIDNAIMARREFRLR